MKVASTVRRGTGRKGSNDLARGLPYSIDKVYVDHWVSQVSKMLHDGVIYRHSVLTR